MRFNYHAVAETAEGDHEFQGYFDAEVGEDHRPAFAAARMMAAAAAAEYGHPADSVTVTAISFTN